MVARPRRLGLVLLCVELRTDARYLHIVHRPQRIIGIATDPHPNVESAGEHSAEDLLVACWAPGGIGAGRGVSDAINS